MIASVQLPAFTVDCLTDFTGRDFVDADGIDAYLAEVQGRCERAGLVELARLLLTIRSEFDIARRSR